MTIMGTIVLALGALLLLAGTFLCVLSHDKFKQLIIRGCLHDAGIACIGLACPSAAARAGFLIYAGFQVLARLLALKSLEDLRPAAPAKLTGNDLWDLRGAGRTAPFTGALFAFGMLAAVGGSAFFIPEGRYLITAGAVSILPQTSLGVYAILLAAACTIVQVWLAVAAVNAVLLTKAPAAPGIEARPRSRSSWPAVLPHSVFCARPSFPFSQQSAVLRLRIHPCMRLSGCCISAPSRAV